VKYFKEVFHVKQNIVKRRVVELSDEVWKLVRLEAIEQGVSVSHLVEQLLSRKLKRLEKSRSREDETKKAK